MNGSKQFFFLIVLFLFLAFVGCDRKTPDSDISAQSLEKKENLLIAPEKRSSMPVFHINSVQYGSPESNEKLSDQVVLIVFFTPWCSSCASEISMLQQLLKNNTLELSSIIGMAVIDPEKQYSELENFIKKLDIEFPVLVSDDQLKKGFGGIFSVPTAFLIDEKGKIAQKYISHLEESTLVDAVNMLKLEK